MDNIELLDSLIGKVRRGFDHKDNPNELVEIITKIMFKHYKKARLTRKDFKTALEQFRTIDKTKHRGLPYDEIEIWLTSKVQRVSMQQITEQMFQSKNAT